VKELLTNQRQRLRRMRTIAACTLPVTPNEESVNIIERTLALVPRPDGFVAAHLVELGTGQVLAGLDGTTPTAAPVPGDPPRAGAGVAASTRAPAMATAVAQALSQFGRVIALHHADEDLEDVVITLTGHHHLVRLLPDLGGTDTFLLLTLDRAHGNLGLARRLLRQLEVAVVA
jgi:hypothetical protein